MTRRRITLQIDRITVAGNRPTEGDISAAIQSELGRMLDNAGTIDPGFTNASIRRIDGGQTKGPATGTAIGQAVARAAMGALSR